MAAEQQAEQENLSVLEEPMVSTQQEAFQAPPSGAYKKVIGMRVMRTRDGRDIPKDTRDLEFLRETGIRNPAQHLETSDVSNLDGMPDVHDMEKQGLYNSVPITFYTAGGGRGGKQGHAGRQGKISFARDNKYSVPIEYSKEREKP